MRALGPQNDVRIAIVHPWFVALARAPSMACAVFRTTMDRDNATSRCPWVSPDDESVIRNEEERLACVSGTIDGRLRRALVVTVEENNDRLSTIDIAKRGVVEIRYCGNFSTPSRPGVVDTDTSIMECARQRWRYTGSTR